MISIGIDIGSVCAKAAVYDGTVISRCMLPTGWNPKETGELIYKRILEESGRDEQSVRAVIATGYGRISVPFATKKITEITCHAKGAVFLDGSTRTIIDVGGQDSKVIAVDEKGSVQEFMMNDKCAAGTGRFLQVMANVLGTEVDRLESLAAGAESRDINSMCAVFAESEVVSLLAQGVSKESVACGILYSISNKIMHITSRIGVKDNILFTGGVSQNQMVRDILSKKLKRQVGHHRHSQFAGAIGAAILGYE